MRRAAYGLIWITSQSTGGTALFSLISGNKELNMNYYWIIYVERGAEKTYRVSELRNELK